MDVTGRSRDSHDVYMMTHSGRLVSPTHGTPTLPDIALALSRQPRFGGHTLRWWSVLDHSLYVAHLGRCLPVEARLALLLHDAHEALTADVPTVFKTPSLRTIQALLDERIADAYFPGGACDFKRWTGVVHAHDRRALLAEAQRVGPPELGVLPEAQFVELFGDVPRALDMTELDTMLLGGTVGDARFVADGIGAPNVRAFIGLYESLHRAAIEQ